jgi:hypothetical protein
MKKTEDQSEPLDRLAQLLAETRRSMIAELERVAQERGELVFDGRWMSPEAIDRAYHRSKRRGQTIVIELLALFLFLAITAMIPLMILVMFIGTAR